MMEISNAEYFRKYKKTFGKNKPFLECEINIDSTEIDKDCMDEWGAAELWLDGEHGVEYNLCYDSGVCESAIYKMWYDPIEEYADTDTDTFIHYEINFDDAYWVQKLIDAMLEAAEKFWKDGD